MMPYLFSWYHGFLTAYNQAFVMTPRHIIALCSCLLLACFFAPASHASTPNTYTKYKNSPLYEVQASRLNMRSKPSLRASVLKTLNRHTKIQILGESSAEGFIWAHVALPATDNTTSGDTTNVLYGWMAKRYLAAIPKQNPKAELQYPAVIETKAPQQAVQTSEQIFELPSAQKSKQASHPPKAQSVEAQSFHPKISAETQAIQGQIARPQDLQFSILARGKGTPSVLVFAGIQGDEPGGFSAASLLTTHYTFTKGQVIIVPNLNFHSIVQRARGTYGDMNRKFAALRQSDPQYQDIIRAKQLIQQSSASVIFNLHDGSGFYRPSYESPKHNPKRWGQSIVIDMDYQADISLPELGKIANYVAARANTRLLHDNDTIFVKNTHTNEGNREMSKTLTWFAIRQGKAAFALEASKNFPVAQRAYYHLTMLENFFTKLGIQFTRSFPLSPQGIQTALDENVFFAFNNGRVRLPLQNIRRKHKTPMSLPRDHQAIVSSPILAATYLDDHQNRLQVHYGNNRLTQFSVRWRDVDTSLPSVELNIDGIKRTVYMGDIIDVHSYLAFLPLERHSIHLIGTNTVLPPSNARSTPFVQTRTFSKKDFASHASLDTHAAMYRIEFLRDDKLAGTLIVRFTPLTQNALLLPQKNTSAKLIP